MDRQVWLDQVVEDALEPELPICDPHHHLWDHPKSRYLLNELLEDIGDGHNVVSTVFMECGSMYSADSPAPMRPVGETEFAHGIATMSTSGGYGETCVCVSIISFADLTLGAAVGEVLDAHMAASPRFRGIRHASGWDASQEVRNSHTSPTEGMLGDTTFREGFAELGRRNLTFDAWLYHPQIPELTDLARAFPNQLIVIDHCGGPLGIGRYQGKREEIFNTWKDDVIQLSKCQNVVAKIGGLLMPINGFGLHKRDKPASSQELADATERYYMHMIEHFGVNRCMFESNFPVDKVSCSYTVLWNSFKLITRDFSASEKAALFHDTATAIYRVET